jgi:hypothetical protein
VLVSHDPGAVERVCQRVVVLDGGRIVFDVPTAEGLLRYHQLMGTEHDSGELLRGAGRDELEISNVELRDAQRRRGSVFATGASLTIVVSLQARVALATPELRLELRGGSGARLFATTTAVELGADGTAQLAFEIPELPLLGGDYDIALGAGEAGSQPPLTRTLRFSVPHQGEDAGPLDLRGHWHAAAALTPPQP